MAKGREVKSISLVGWGGKTKRGLEWNKWRENHYGWDFIFSGEEEGGVGGRGQLYIFFMIGEVYFRNGPG